jgi:hypothetical protein
MTRQSGMMGFDRSNALPIVEDGLCLSCEQLSSLPIASRRGRHALSVCFFAN